MKTEFITNLGVFSELYEINLNADPNQTFTTTLNGAIYDFDIKTLIDGTTLVTIKRDGVLICECAPVSVVNRDLTYLSREESGQFFFYKNVDSNLIAFNYSNFGAELRLFYGVLEGSANNLSDLETHYSLLKNQGSLAVF